MPDANYMDDVHVRMLRVTEDLRAIQRELNCAAMQAPSDPELMEALSQLPEIESLELLKSALDQMRHFLWFYVQVMTAGAEAQDRPQPGPRRARPHRPPRKPPSSKNSSTRPTRHCSATTPTARPASPTRSSLPDFTSPIPTAPRWPRITVA